jgi:hypothetical protein
MKIVNAVYSVCDPDAMLLQYLLVTLPPCGSQEPVRWTNIGVHIVNYSLINYYPN